MKILIESIPHSQQRYPTAGDWFCEEARMVTVQKEAGTEYIWIPRTLHIRVSKMNSSRSEQLVAIHELVEALACNWDGIPESAIDSWDNNFEGAGEPGDHPNAPYYEQHTLATAVERFMAQAFHISWKEHNAEVEKLFAQEVSEVPEVPVVFTPPAPAGQCTDLTKDLDPEDIPF